MTGHATGAPAISGTAQAGMVLTASPGTIADADGLVGVSYSYQWIRVDGADETDIAGANTASYTPVEADVGKTLKVRASFTDNAGFAEQRTSAATVTVTAANKAPTASDASVTTGEDTAYTFAAADFNFDDTDTGDALALDGVPVTANQAGPNTTVVAWMLSWPFS